MPPTETNRTVFTYLDGDWLQKDDILVTEFALTINITTELALQLADQLGITTVGFIRHQSFNVYTHPERIAMPAGAGRKPS